MQPLILSTGGIKRPAEQPELRTDRSTTRCAVYQDTFVSTGMFNKMVPDIAAPLRLKPGYAEQIRTMIAQDIAYPVRGVVERLKQDPQLIACLKRILCLNPRIGFCPRFFTNYLLKHSRYSLLLEAFFLQFSFKIKQARM